MVTFQERVRGVVLATALGDAMGAPIEKLSYDEIKAKYGRVEGLNTKWYKEDYPPEQRLNRMRGRGIITDDTLMTLALMRVYNAKKRHLDAYDMGEEFLKEIAFRTTFIPEFAKEALIIDRLFYPEKYIFMRHTLSNCDPREGGIGNMVNCGAAMYIAPIGVVNACNPKAAYDEAIAFAMGHQCSYGLEAAGVLAACVAKAFEPGVLIEDIVNTAIKLAKDGTKNAIRDLVNIANNLKEYKEDKDRIVNAFHEALLKYSPMGNDVGRHIDKVGKPSNHYTPSRLFSIEELPLALAYILLNEGEFYESLLDGINSGRDTDSIGVMIGVILCAMKGYKVIKESDIELLEGVNKLNLMESADGFYITAKEIINKDLEKYEKRKELLKSIS
ncbi:ADP-ribosylglycohydrolase family protein [Clostridium malenominatum]|uniref:ADP-ribosylglycohydrolase family protein n=1 Tax=Clostridium malenominatum TaxID=1539 RepID=A0ABN1IT20_9CLOT